MSHDFIFASNLPARKTRYTVIQHKRGVVIMVSIDRSIIHRIKNGRDHVTYRGVLVPPYSSVV